MQSSRECGTTEKKYCLKILVLKTTVDTESQFEISRH